MLYGSLDGRRVWERMDTHICMAKSLPCSQTIMALFVNQLCPNTKYKVFKKKLFFRAKKPHIRHYYIIRAKFIFRCILTVKNYSFLVEGGGSVIEIKWI